MRPSGHLHTGLCATTEQTALTPHAPGHGSTHLALRQPLLVGQSELMVHSGRQGMPKYPGWQEQTGWPAAFVRHTELTPHGLGWQGSGTGSFGSRAAGMDRIK